MNNNKVEEVLRKRNLKLLDVNKGFYDTKSKVDLIDDKGFKYSLSFDVINDKRTKSFNIVDKHNKFSIDNIQKIIKDRGSDTKVISTAYVSSKGMLDLQCECGEFYQTYWNHIWSVNKIRCTKCGHKIREDNHRFSVEKVEQICKENGYILLSKNFKRINNIVVEDKFGYKYKTSLYSIQKENEQLLKFHKYNPYTIENINNYLKINNVPVSLVNNKNIKVKIKEDYLEFYCQSCGKPYKATWQQVILSKRYRCTNCIKIKSNLEYKVEQYLKAKNINYSPQKRFEDCRNIKPLPFDFYLTDYNCCIEVNGGQHYYENKIFKQDLKERQRMDRIKEEYCVKNNITFLAIPFWHIENSELYKKEIDNIINQN